jgi:hypothetical protein
MSKADFVKLIKDFCVFTKIKDTESVVRDGAIIVDGVMFSLIHNEKGDENDFSIYTDFGELPSKRELEIASSLMETNLFLAALKGPVFAMSPETKRITMVVHYKILNIDSKRLCDILAELSSAAKSWKENYFLDLKPTPKGAKKGVFASLYGSVR